MLSRLIIHIDCDILKTLKRGELVQKLNGFIMSKDIPVVKVENGIASVINESLAPLFFARCSDVFAWLESRAIDSHRANSRLLKKALRLSNKDDVGTVLTVNAVTITDNYWFKETDSALKWEDVCFKENLFDNLALCGDPDSFNQKPSRTPELTNIGSYEKCWRLIDGKWWMYKNGNELELFSELFIYNLGRKLGFNMAFYELADGYIRTLDFTDNASVNFETADGMVGDNEDYNDNFEILLSISESVAKDYLRLVYLDTLCMNMDRHTKNYGVLRDTVTGKVISLAPNYDNNIALVSRGYPKNISRENDLLIELFTELLNENEKAYALFKDMSIPKLTEDIINECIDDTALEIDRDFIVKFVLNGVYKIEEYLIKNSDKEK